MIIFQPTSMDLFEPVETPLLFPDGAGGMYHPKGFIVPPDYMRQNIIHPNPPWTNIVDRIADKDALRVMVPELETEEITSRTVADISLAYLGKNGSKVVYARNKGKADVKYLPPSSGGIVKTELSREYLKYSLGEATNVLKCPRIHAWYNNIPPTLYYEGKRHHGNYAYVDISQAYWTIQKTSTIDMRYIPGRVVVTARAPFLNVPEVTAFRALRQIIPGSLREGSMQRVRHGVPEDCSFKGALFFPGIIGYTMHVMHAVAREVIDHFGALMVLTDGFIIPQERARDLVQFLLERWNLHSVIQAEGDGAVYDHAMYQVGTKKSRKAPDHYTTARRWNYTVPETGREMVIEPAGNPLSTLVSVDTSWLQKQRKIILQQGLGTV